MDKTELYTVISVDISDDDYPIYSVYSVYNKTELKNEIVKTYLSDDDNKIDDYNIDDYKFIIVSSAVDYSDTDKNVYRKTITEKSYIKRIVSTVKILTESESDDELYSDIFGILSVIGLLIYTNYTKFGKLNIPENDYERIR